MPRSKAKPTQHAQKGRPQDNDREGDSSEERSIQNNDNNDEEATFLLHRPWPNDNRSSFFAQASLLGLLSVIVVTLISGSFLAVLSSHGKASYSTAHRANNAIGGNPANLLGLYHVKVATSSNRMLPSSTQPSVAEAFFLKYYTMPSGNDNDWALAALMDSNHSDTDASLLQVVAQELADATHHDILEPLVERWKGRMDAVKRRITGESTKEETAIAIHQNVNAIPPHSIFGIYPSTDHSGVIDEEAYKRHHPPRTKILTQTLETATALPKKVIRRSRRGQSVCPTSLFCYYRLPATIENSKNDNNNPCARYCGRCFQTKRELQKAVDRYLKDNSPLSDTAQRYGWPMQNWCVSLITDFSGIFANAPDAFHEDLTSWDLSSASHYVEGDIPGR